jgi:hypothetical protein
MDFLAALGRTWNDAFMLSQVPIPDSDDVLILSRPLTVSATP